MDQKFPAASDRKDMISYYRWVPLILLCQGCSFYLINILWEFLIKKSVINCEEIVNYAQECNLKDKNRETKLSNISQHIFDLFQYEFPANPKFYNNGYCMATFYLIFKFLNLINCCLNLWLLESFLGNDFLPYGFTAFLNIFNSLKRNELTRFPRVIMCDFNIRTMANENNKTVQCVLMMNMINEKIFLFFYFWLWFLAIVTFINLFYHFGICFCRSYQTEYIFVHASKKDRSEEFIKFSQHFLKPDGILLIKFIRQNAGGRITSDIVKDLFEKYLAMAPLALPSKLEKPLNLIPTNLIAPTAPPLPKSIKYEETPKRKNLPAILPFKRCSAFV
uniref:Innexin n=1 Tax=Panagrolaimus superbus TaxID=310955 RepID=A0A914YSG1_9BILA